MSRGYFFIPKRLTRGRFVMNPQEVRASHWMENLIFKGN